MFGRGIFALPKGMETTNSEQILKKNSANKYLAYELRSEKYSFLKKLHVTV